MLKTGFSAWPSYSEIEAKLVSDVILSNKVNYWTGSEGQQFESEFARWAGTRHAIAVANGTVALDLAWRALGIGPGDEVVVTPRTYIASASSIINAGATPVFADVDADSGVITPESVEAVLTDRTRAIEAVHLAGWPCDMSGLHDLVGGRSIFLVEDCAQAHGATFRGRSVGSLGDVAAWSFCQDKIMTTAGEGGMVTTDNDDWWSSMWSYKDHGKSYNAVHKRLHPPGFRWLHESFGTNWRMTEAQAAVGRYQLRQMPTWHESRKANAEQLLSAGRATQLFRVPEIPAEVEHAWYKCYMYVRSDLLRHDWSRDRVIAEINARGVPCYSGSCSEIYLEKAFDGTPWRPQNRLPVARELGETSVMFLVHPTLTANEIARTCQAIWDVAAGSTR